MRNQNTYYSVVPDHNFVCTLYFEAKNWFLERVFMVALELYGWLPNLVLQFNRSQQEEEGSSRLDYKSKRTEMHSQFLTVFLERRDRAALGRKFWFASASPLLTLERLDSPLSNAPVLVQNEWKTLWPLALRHAGNAREHSMPLIIICRGLKRRYSKHSSLYRVSKKVWKSTK